MSIYDELVHRVHQGRLVEMQSLMPGTYTQRHLFVTPEINALLEDWSEPRYGQLRGDFDHFVSGLRIAIRMPPSKDVDAYLALLEPVADQVWELRSVAPEPQIRVFGRFAQKDTFVALGLALRRDLGDDIERWRAEMEASKHKWRTLFNPYQPLSSVDPDDYVSKYFLV